MFTNFASFPGQRFDRPLKKVPLVWAATTPKSPLANLGDALSPMVVSALSGLPVVHKNFNAAAERLACVGTIAHELKNGTVHLWGTGVDPDRSPTRDQSQGYQCPPRTQFKIHALRGKLTARTLQNQGMEVPDLYGDPIWFLPALIPPAPEKRYELGIIVHVSELATLQDAPQIRDQVVRYTIANDLASQIRIFTTLTAPTFNALEARTQEITACKRIVSTSLHGLVIAETYNIPCVYFRPRGKGSLFLPLDDDTSSINHRIRDFYSGTETERLWVYGQRRDRETDWEKVMNAIDTHWTPLTWNPEPFLESFPLPLAFNPLKEKGGDRSLFEKIKL
jgi:pyruvyltransferase